MIVSKSEQHHEEQTHFTVFERMDLIDGRWTSPVGDPRFAMNDKPVDDLNKIPFPKEDEFGTWRWACCWKIIQSKNTNARGWVLGNRWHFPDGEVDTRIRLWRRIAIYVRSYESPKKKYKHNLEPIDAVIRRIVTQLFWYALLNSDNAVKAGVMIYPDQDGFDETPYLLGGESYQAENKEDIEVPEEDGGEDLKSFNQYMIEFQIRMKCISLRTEDQYKNVKDILEEEKIEFNPEDEEEKRMIDLLLKCLTLLKECIKWSALHDDEKALDWKERTGVLEKLSKVCTLYAAIKESDIICMRTMGFYLVYTFLDAIEGVTKVVTKNDPNGGLLVFDLFREQTKEASAVRKNEFQESACFSIDLLTEMQDILKIIESAVEEEYELTERTHKVLKDKMEESTKILAAHLGSYHFEDPEIVHDTFNIFARMRRIYEYEAKDVPKGESLKLIESWMKKSAGVLFEKLWNQTEFSVNLDHEDIGSDEFEGKWDAFINQLLWYIKADLDLCDRLRKSGVVEELSQYATIELVTRLLTIILEKILQASKSIENKYGRLLLSGFRLENEIGEVLVRLEPKVPKEDHEIIKLLSNVLDAEAEVRFLGWIVESGDGMASLIPGIVARAKWEAGLADCKSEDEDTKYSQVVVDVFLLLNAFQTNFLNYLEIFPDSFTKQGKMFFQNHLLRLVNHFLIEIKHSVEMLAESFSPDECKVQPFSNEWDEPEHGENAYLTLIEKLCVQFSTVTCASHYIKRLKEEFKKKMVDCVEAGKYTKLLEGYAETFFNDASMLVNTFTKKIGELIVKHIVSLEIETIWQDNLWVQPVDKNTLNKEIFEMLKSYMEVLDHSLTDSDYQIILLDLMKELNCRVTLLLTNEENKDRAVRRASNRVKSVGRFFEQKDGEIIFKDFEFLHGFFKKWEYEGPAPGEKEYPFASFYEVVNYMKKSTNELIKYIQSENENSVGLGLSDMAKIDMGKVHYKLQVLSFRTGDKQAQDYVKEMRPPERERSITGSLNFRSTQVSGSRPRASSQGGKISMWLKVSIFSATNLAACDRNGLSDPYVIVEVFDKQKNPIDKKQRTRFMKKTLEPTWNESKYFTIPTGYFGAHTNLSVKFTCMDKNRLGSDQVIGETSILFAQQQASSRSERSLDLALKNEFRGTLKVRLELLESAQKLRK